MVPAMLNVKMSHGDIGDNFIIHNAQNIHAQYENILYHSISMSCPFKSIFGDPGTGVHAMRIPVLDIAVVDTSLTFMGAWAIQRVWFPAVPYWKVFLVFFLIGELMHWLFCVKSRVLEYAGVL